MGHQSLGLLIETEARYRLTPCDKLTVISCDNLSLKNILRKNFTPATKLISQKKKKKIMSDRRYQMLV